jgi:hypothetical protein
VTILSHSTLREEAQSSIIREGSGIGGARHCVYCVGNHADRIIANGGIAFNDSTDHGAFVFKGLNGESVSIVAHGAGIGFSIRHLAGKIGGGMIGKAHGARAGIKGCPSGIGDLSGLAMGVIADGSGFIQGIGDTGGKTGSILVGIG